MIFETWLAFALGAGVGSELLFADSFENPELAVFVAESSTFLGAKARERITGSGFLADGRPIVAGTLQLEAAQETLLNGATADSRGLVAILAQDAQSIERIVRVGDEINDMAVDGDGNIALALRDAGLAVVNSSLDAVVFATTGFRADRVDSGDAGCVAVLADALQSHGVSPNTEGSVRTFDAAGSEIASFGAHRKTYDIAIAPACDRVFSTGFRQTNGPSGNPVQIAYLRAQDLNGNIDWTGYDWTGTEVDDPRAGGSGPRNNMADTRGLRLHAHDDGFLYAAFVSAGGNHIFRHDPFDLFGTVDIVGGDRFHEFFNTRSENKTFLGKYRQDTGAYIRGQQFVNRLMSGGGNTITLTQGGDIEVDSHGQVYLSGAAASGMPLTLDPLPDGSYTGGAFLYVMSEDLAERRLVTRFTPDGVSHTIALDQRNAFETRILFAGETDEQLITDRPIQATFGGGETDGFATFIVNR